MDTSHGIILNGEPFDESDYVPSRLSSAYNPMHTFDLPRGAEKQWSQQYADTYFLRLTQLKEAVRQRALEEWADFKIKEDKAEFVDRVLDVRQGQLCWIIGTVYMEMKEKPNIMDDIHKHYYITAPPKRTTYISGKDEMMLEDESGRLKIHGEVLNNTFVTGVVIAALGTEDADGRFHVIATQHADLPPQPERWERDDAELDDEDEQPERAPAGKVAIVSGLNFTGDKDDQMALDMMTEYLIGDASGAPEQTKSSKISRLIIAGDSMAKSSPILDREEIEEARAERTGYGYDPSSYNPYPAARFDEFLDDICSGIPVTLMPGASDPANIALPQERLHPAIFPLARHYANPSMEADETLEGLDCVTNPWEGDIEGWRFAGTSGQNVDDFMKYVKGVDVVDALEKMLRWRSVAPTAPDTLWCYPFQDDDPLLVKECPHIFFVGNQKKFGKRIITGPEGQQVMLISVPRFNKTKTMVVLDLETLGVETVLFKGKSPRHAAYEKAKKKAKLRAKAKAEAKKKADAAAEAEEKANPKPPVEIPTINIESA